MIKSRLFLLPLAACAVFTSCFKDEEPNAECDIQKAFVHMDKPEDVFAQKSDTLVDVRSNVSDVVFYIKPGVDVSKMAPQFELTPGATIYPESGTEFDFSDEKKVQYTVTSEDKSWKRTYNVSFEISELPTKYDFENVELYYETDPKDKVLKPKYYIWYDLSPNGKKIYDWASGNAGFKLSNYDGKPEIYPTVPMDDGNGPEGGKYGKYVKLTTSDTGAWGVIVNRRLAAGNLFIGVFDPLPALTNTLLCTRFGLPFSKKPLRLTGYYKYKPGEKLQDKNGKPIEGKIDRGTIYAVMYRNHDANGNAIVLNGNDVKTNPNIVALADIGEISETPEWNTFSINFVYSADLDKALLESNGYSISVVCSSSVEGDKFEGAVGSTLCVDELELVFE